jgi:hypothetical protein
MGLAGRIQLNHGLGSLNPKAMTKNQIQPKFKIQKPKAMRRYYHGK